jgi:hypothetical protein
MALEDFEELNSSILNITQLSWTAPTLKANFGGGYGAGCVVSSYGLHKWSLTADLIPDLDDYTVDYEVDGDEFTDPRFTYVFEFIKRQMLLGNKPFVLTDTRTGKKYLVSFTETNFDFSQITAKIFAGGLTLVERRSSDLSFNADGSIDLDYTAPTGSLSVSQNGGLYAGTVTITATVSDDVAIQKVRFYIDHEFLSEDSSSAYTASWDTTLHKNGIRKVRAKIYDTSGNVTVISALIDVANDEDPPTVSITSPSAGADVSGTITINAAAADNISVDRVEFYYYDGAGFAFISSDASSPYSASFDTSLVDDGELVLSATAFDDSGNPSTPAYVTVNATNDSEAPTTPTSFVLDTENLPTSSSVGLTWLGSSDNVAVTEYQVQYATNSGFTTGVGTQDFSPVGGPGDDEPHIVTGLSPSTTYYFRVRAKDAAGNYSSYTSSVNTMTEATGGYDPVTALGSKLIVYLDAEQISGVDGDPVATIPNTGTENDWSKIDGTVTLSVESGKKAINIAAGGRLQGGSTTPALSTWTFYAVVKMVTDPTENHYVLLTHIFSGSKAIIVGFVDNKFEYYDTPRTEVGNASTGSYQLIKCTVGTTAAGQWLLAGQLDVAFKVRAVIGCNDSLTGGEESALETWLATKL